MVSSTSYSAYKNEFRSLHVMDEIKGIPIQKAVITSNMFSLSVSVIFLCTFAIILPSLTSEIAI